MKPNAKLVRKRRKFSQDFKRQLVKEFEKGQYSVPQLSKLHCIAPKVIYSWIYKFSTFNEKGSRVIEMKESSSKKVKDLEKKVKQLEQIVGQKQIMIDYLEKMIDLAKDRYGMDIKKNSDILPSTGSGSIKSK